MATKEKISEKEVVKTSVKSSPASKAAAKTAVEESFDGKTEPKAKSSKAAKTVSHEQIRHKAYEIYLETGCTNEHENWVKAEKELLYSK